MKRLFLASLLACGVLGAWPSVFSSCTDGTTTLSPCSNDPTLATGGISGPGYSVNAYAGVSMFSTDITLDSVHFSNINSGTELQALANTVTVFDPGPTSTVPTAATAQASDTQSFTSGGTPSLGNLELQVALGYIHENEPGSATVTVTQGANTYTYDGSVSGSVICNQEVCEYGTTLPFELGAPFQITVSANSQIVPFENEGGHDAGATILFGLFDANGAPVPSTSTPEPTTFGLLAIAATASIVLCRRRARRPL